MKDCITSLLIILIYILCIIYSFELTSIIHPAIWIISCWIIPGVFSVMVGSILDSMGKYDDAINCSIWFVFPFLNICASFIGACEILFISLFGEK